MGAVAQRRQDPPLRAFETIVENWGETVFLIKGKDRHGNQVYSLRMCIGELDPWRFGPYASKREAIREMERLTTEIFERTSNIPAEMGGEYASNQEW